MIRIKSFVYGEHIEIYV